MSPSKSQYADLTSEQLDKLRSLEGELGKIVLAIEPDSLPNYAPLTRTQVQKIVQLEQDLGVVLLAYKASPK